MPAKSGVNFIVQVADDDVQTITLSGGGGTDSYKLLLEGETTAAIDEGATAATVESAIEALSGVATADVAVTGTAGGPYTVTFSGAFAGADVRLDSVDETGTLSVAIAEAASGGYTTIAAGRSGTLNRGTDTADFTNKDSNEWSEELPIIRNWSIEFDHLLIEGDTALTRLEDAHLNNRRVLVRMQTPAGNTYSGTATISDFNYDGPHDDIMTATGTLNGSGDLTKA